MNNVKQTVHNQIENACELLRVERDKIHGELIHRYCDDDNGNMIHCYSRAIEIARQHGENILCDIHDDYQRQIDLIDELTSKL